MTELVANAAAVNAQWCHAMCRAHRLDARFTERAWVSPRRTPPYYPDAITLEPAAEVGDLLPDIDSGAGCSIKDSYALLDLTRDGFVVLFDASWIHRPATAEPAAPAEGDEWRIVDTVDGLARWEQNWADDTEPPDIFVPQLLADPDVAIIAGYRDDRFLGGAVAHRGETGIEVSNLFDLRVDVDATWQAVLHTARSRFGALPVFGYEHGPDLDVALRNGFEAIGPLRVWWRRV